MSSLLGERFVLERRIGTGGMSVVYLGRDKVLDRPVAVKVLRGGFEDSEVDARFRREGRTAARLSHPNIVQVYDAGEDEFDGRHVSYIVMEYVSGGDLEALLDKKGPLVEKELARIGADIASGLVHAHERGIVHRDIKPHNILIDSYGRPKLTDFGIARALDATQATRTGSYLGTASYSSPEQLRGGEITTKSDVYSLGCTLYQAAVGESPFSGSPIEVASQQLTKSPTPPRARGAALSESLEALILASLAKDPADRPDAAGLQEQLLRISAVASGAVTITPPADQAMRSLVGVAGIVNAAGTAKAAGTKGFETVVEGLKERVGSAGASERTLVASAGAFRPRWARRAAFAAGLVTLLLLALVAVTGMPTLLNDGEKIDQTADGVQDTAKSSAETAAVEFTPATSEPAPSLDTAENAVFDMYIKASYRNFDAAWAYLSQRKQNEEGSKERWAERQKFNDLWYVDFPQMPKAKASGDEARVSFKLEETHSADKRITTGTWVSVNEGGKWKLDRLEVKGTETLN
ncbi:MAG TPA: serine/threonine-protein kinase [Rubrobacteraceae bacterium]|nr:serine/threonine-protein kinase [Rubrobacteraceae bacterium]